MEKLVFQLLGLSDLKGLTLELERNVIFRFRILIFNFWIYVIKEMKVIVVVQFCLFDEEDEKKDNKISRANAKMTRVPHPNVF
jgi:hypothetical protein